jgi:hypothetical protein
MNFVNIVATVFRVPGLYRLLPPRQSLVGTDVWKNRHAIFWVKQSKSKYIIP